MIKGPFLRRATLPLRSLWWGLQMGRGKCVTYAHMFEPGVQKGDFCKCGKRQWGVYPDGW